MKKLLSINGGGIRGIVAAKVIAALETRLGSVSEKVDMIAGTSTGGLLALALVKPVQKSAAEMVQFYLDTIPKVFETSVLGQLRAGWGLWSAKYDPAPLEAAGRALVGSALLSQAVPPVLLTAYNLSKELPVLISPDWSFLDAGMATSAAPVAFPPYSLAGTDCIDGGMFATNPALLGALALGLPDVACVSVGCGELDPIGPPINTGLSGWALKLDLFHEQAQDQSTDRILSGILPKYVRLSPRITGVKHNDVSPSLLPTLVSQTDSWIASNGALLDQAAQLLSS